MGIASRAPEHDVVSDYTVGEACLYFLFGLLIPVIGLFIALGVDFFLAKRDVKDSKRIRSRAWTPALVGFCFSFALIDLLMLCITGMAYGLSALTCAFLIVIYYRVEPEQRLIDGTKADFVFFMTLSFFTNALGFFFAMFQRRRLGRSGGTLGFMLSMMAVSIVMIVFGALSWGQALIILVTVGAISLVIAIALFVVYVLKILRQDPTSMNFLTFLLITTLFGPFGILAAILNPDINAFFGGIFGIFVWVFFGGLSLTITGVGRLLAVGIPLMIAALLLIAASCWLYSERINSPSEDAHSSQGLFGERPLLG